MAIGERKLKAEKLSMADMLFSSEKVDARRTIELELAQIAGVKKEEAASPGNALSLHCRTLFDMVGLAKAKAMMADGDADKDIKDRAHVPGDRQEGETAENESGFFTRFADLAFKNGRLFCSIEENGGKLMLTSCIQHALSRRTPKPVERIENAGFGATRRPLVGNAMEVSYRKHVKKALSLVINTAQSLGKTMEQLEMLAENDVPDFGGLEDMDTIFNMFPFLSVNAEKQKLANFREAVNLAEPGSEEKNALEFGVSRLGAIISHKTKLRTDFLTRLRHISDSSKLAAEMLSKPTVVDEIVQGLLEIEDDEDEPEEKDEPRVNRRKKK